MTAGPDRPARTALIVDDDDDLAAAFVRALERRGYTAHRARTGAEAIGMAGGFARLDAALVDLVLPGIGGIEVVQHLRRTHPACRIVAMTGLSAPSIASAFLAAGADRFLLKPLKLPDLYAALEDPAA